MKREKKPETTKATIGFIPNGMNGLIHARHPRTSTSHAHAAIATDAMPAVKIT